MTPREAYAGTHYRMPLHRRARRFLKTFWRWLTAPCCEL